MNNKFIESLNISLSLIIKDKDFDVSGGNVKHLSLNLHSYGYDGELSFIVYCEEENDEFLSPMISNNLIVVKLKIENNEVVNPYKMLPPIFDGWTPLELEETLSEMEGIADGGAALTAYAKLQYQDMGDKERTEITEGLLRYCELDTLAMVMIYEHFREICQL